MMGIWRVEQRLNSSTSDEGFCSMLSTARIRSALHQNVRTERQDVTHPIWSVSELLVNPVKPYKNSKI